MFKASDGWISERFSRSEPLLLLYKVVHFVDCVILWDFVGF